MYVMGERGGYDDLSSFPYIFEKPHPPAQPQCPQQVKKNNITC